MARDREPWVKVKIGARRSGKLAGLPSDTARLGYFYTLLEAKVQRRMGVFDNRAHFVEVLGRFGRYLPQYLEIGLVHEAPLTCVECKRRNTQIRPGELVVHDYQREQRDPTNADRQAAWREAHGDGEGNADRNADSDGAVTATVTGTVTGNEAAAGIDDDDDPGLARTRAHDRAGARPREAGDVSNQPESAQLSTRRNGVSNADPGATVTADSRARGTTATRTTTERVPRSNRRKRAGASEAEGPLLTAAQLDAWSSFGPEWEPFKAAWLERGLRLPPSGGADEEGSQRATLFPIVRDWPTQVAGWVRGAPKGASGTEIVGHVIGRYRDAVAAEPDEETPDWLAPPTRAEATEALSSILGRPST